MNQRFFSVLSLAAALAFTTACRTNKPVADTGIAEEAMVETETAAGGVPVWAPKKHSFKPSRTREHDLLHTRLRVSFDWQKQHLKGNAELTLKPYFYPQNRLVLDAKGFDIHSINLLKGNDGTPLKHTYDGKQLTIELGKTYTRDEKYTVEINYTAKPNELATGGSAAITEDKGLYFINPLGTEPNKPRQIWTQGETEASSAWFPTIDSPNERMTQEIYITVDPKFTTLSNGTFVYSRKNADGTKTDFWKLEQPHAPYLAMMAIGEYAVVKDKWRDLEVSYYVEPAYKNTARKIFGHTPEMLEFFSTKLGVAYPWPSKYAQVVVRDFVSGAMENTTASTFMEDLQLTERELLDKNWDNIIAHELFHQWFGDYVTTESWANLPLNESFANYSEYLWAEHKFGPDQAAYQQLEELSQYLDESQTKREPLIRYYHHDKEEMFDSHSYAKGGRVLHMLRKYVGDDAFFTSLNHYLTKNKFTEVEIAELRMAFEDVTGQDLMWFFDQWFLNAGHPELAVSHSYANGQVQLQVVQQQDTTYAPVYRLPLKVAMWVNGKREEHAINITKASQTFQFPAAAQPQLVLFDSEHQLLATIEHAKTDQELAFQFRNSNHFTAKYEALGRLGEKPADPEVQKVLGLAMKDDFWFIRSMAINALGDLDEAQTAPFTADLLRMAQQDKKGTVRSDALLTLAARGGEKHVQLYEQAMRDSSYVVAAAGILAYAATGAPDTGTRLAPFEKEENEDITLALSNYYAAKGGAGKQAWFAQKIKQSKGTTLYYLLQSYGAFLVTYPETHTAEVINQLGELAKNHNLYYIRMSAYQALLALAEKPEAKTWLDDIKKNEKDERLKQLYNQ